MRGDNYETKHDIDDLEALSEKLQADLRANIHMLQHHEVLSPDWCEMSGLMANRDDLGDGGKAAEGFRPGNPVGMRGGGAALHPGGREAEPLRPQPS